MTRHRQQRSSAVKKIKLVNFSKQAFLSCGFDVDGRPPVVPPLPPVHLQQDEREGLRGQRAGPRQRDSLPAAQPEQGRGGRLDCVFQPDHGLPFPGGQPAMSAHARTYARACCCAHEKAAA